MNLSALISTESVLTKYNNIQLKNNIHIIFVKNLKDILYCIKYKNLQISIYHIGTRTEQFLDCAKFLKWYFILRKLKIVPFDFEIVYFQFI